MSLAREIGQLLCIWELTRGCSAGKSVKTLAPSKQLSLPSAAVLPDGLDQSLLYVIIFSTETSPLSVHLKSDKYYK